MFKKRGVGLQKSKPIDILKNDDNHISDSTDESKTQYVDIKTGNESITTDSDFNQNNTKKLNFSTKEKTEDEKNLVDNMMKDLAYESNYNLVINKLITIISIIFLVKC